MAKKKTTKAKAKPKIVEKTVEVPEVEPVQVEEAPAPNSKAAVIQAVIKNPKRFRFIAEKVKGYAIAHGNHYIKFEENTNLKIGEYFTDDPAEIEILINDPMYGIYFYSEDPLLR